MCDMNECRHFYNTCVDNCLSSTLQTVVLQPARAGEGGAGCPRPEGLAAGLRVPWGRRAEAARSRGGERRAGRADPGACGRVAAAPCRGRGDFPVGAEAPERRIVGRGRGCGGGRRGVGTERPGGWGGRAADPPTPGPRLRPILLQLGLRPEAPVQRRGEYYLHAEGGWELAPCGPLGLCAGGPPFRAREWLGQAPGACPCPSGLARSSELLQGE